MTKLIFKLKFSLLTQTMNMHIISIINTKGKSGKIAFHTLDKRSAFVNMWRNLETKTLQKNWKGHKQWWNLLKIIYIYERMLNLPIRNTVFFYLVGISECLFTFTFGKSLGKELLILWSWWEYKSSANPMKSIVLIAIVTWLLIQHQWSSKWCICRCI